MRHNDLRVSRSFLKMCFFQSHVLLIFFLFSYKVGSDTVENNNYNSIFSIDEIAQLGQTCHDCLTLPNMGWCGTVDWNGFCLEGTPQGPRHLPCWYYWSYYLCPPSDSAYVSFIDINITSHKNITPSIPCFSSYNCNVSGDVYTLSGGQNWTFTFLNPVNDGWGITNAMVIGSFAFCSKNNSDIKLSFHIDSRKKTTWTSSIVNMNESCANHQASFELVYMSFDSDGVWWEDYMPGKTERTFYIENNSEPGAVLAVLELYMLIISRIVDPLVQSSYPSMAMYCTECENPVVTVDAINYGRSQFMNYLCLFNQSGITLTVEATLVNSTSYECVVPMNESRLIPPLLSRPSIIQYQLIPHGYMGPTVVFSLTVYQLPILEWSNPVVGDLSGGTKVSIFGRGFFYSDSLVVLLGEQIIPAEFVSDTEIRFVTFPYNMNETSTNVTLCVSMDGGIVYTSTCLSFIFINPIQALIWLFWTLGAVAALLLMGAVIAVCRAKCNKTEVPSTPLLMTPKTKSPLIGLEMSNKGGEADPVKIKERKPLFEKKMKEFFGKSKEKYKYDDWEDYKDDEQSPPSTPTLSQSPTSSFIL